MAKVVRTGKEIEDLRHDAVLAEIEGSKYFGMSYEEGIAATLRWLFDRKEEHPINEK